MKTSMNAQRHFMLIVTLLSVALSGCFSPYLKRDASAPVPNPSDTLVAGFFIHSEKGEEKSAATSLIKAAQNSRLDEFGEKATEMHARALSRFGYTAKFDGARSKQLDLIQVGQNAAISALTGSWRHPDASRWGPIEVNSIGVTPAGVVAKLKDEKRNEYFAFTNIEISERGWFFVVYPTVIVRTAIFDPNGRKVLDIGAIGNGKSSVFVCDRSPENLQKALEAAFNDLSVMKEENL